MKNSNGCYETFSSDLSRFLLGVALVACIAREPAGCQTLPRTLNLAPHPIPTNISSQTRIAYTRLRIPNQNSYRDTRYELIRIAYTRLRIPNQNSYRVYTVTDFRNNWVLILHDRGLLPTSVVFLFCSMHSPMTNSLEDMPATDIIYGIIRAAGRYRLLSAYSPEGPASFPAWQALLSLGVSL